MSEHWTSYSGLTTHRHCPQRWHYAHVQKLERIPDPSDVPVEMEFGSWWHAIRAADAIERGIAKGSLRWKPEEIRTVNNGPTFSTEQENLVEALFEGAQRWWDTLGREVQDVWISRLGEPLADRLSYVDQRWRDRWVDDLAHEEPLAVEFKWTRELPTLPQPDGRRVDPETSLIGYIDEILFDAKRNVVVVKDHKTTGAQLGMQSVIDDMMDSQLQLYAWGASPEVTKWERGPVQAVAYDRVRTVKPKTPKLNQSGTLSKTVTDFDYHTYLAWAKGPDGLGQPYPGLKKDGSGAGFYQPEQWLLDDLAGASVVGKWLRRTLTPINRNVVRAHLRAAVDSALDIQLTRERIELSQEAARNLGGGCKYCVFVDLCRAQMMGGPEGEYTLSDYKLRQRVERKR